MCCMVSAVVQRTYAHVHIHAYTCRWEAAAVKVEKPSLKGGVRGVLDKIGGASLATPSSPSPSLATPSSPSPNAANEVTNQVANQVTNQVANQVTNQVADCQTKEQQPDTPTSPTSPTPRPPTPSAVAVGSAVPGTTVKTGSAVPGTSLKIQIPSSPSSPPTSRRPATL